MHTRILSDVRVYADSRLADSLTAHGSLAYGIKLSVVSPPDDLPSDPLERYRAKRSADRTPEPSGRVAARAGAALRHAQARRELACTSTSGSSSRGRSCPGRSPGRLVRPGRQAARGARRGSPDRVRRLRGHHPRGELRRRRGDRLGPGHLDAASRIRSKGFKKGKLLFDLHGHKLQGRWTLVKIKKSQKDWLLIKERDGWLTPERPELPEESVLSGRTVEELRDGRDLADADPGRAGQARREAGQAGRAWSRSRRRSPRRRRRRSPAKDGSSSSSSTAIAFSPTSPRAT